MIRRLAQLAGALMLLCIFRTELAALILFTLVFVIWMLVVVIAYFLGSVVEAIPAVLKAVISIRKTEEICNDSF